MNQLGNGEITIFDLHLKLGQAKIDYKNITIQE